MNERRKLLLRTVPFLAIGILFFLIYLGLFVDIQKMIEIIQGANMLFFSLAAVALLLEILLFSLAWQHLLLPLSVKVPLKKTFIYVWIGAFTDLLVPAESVSGEVAKTYLVSREFNANPGKVVASLVSQRMLGTITTTATLFIGFLALITLDYSIPNFVLQIFLSITIVSVFALVLIIVLCIKEKWTERLINAVMRLVERISRGRIQLKDFQTRIVEALRAFYDSLRIFGANPTKLLPPILFHVVSWVFSIAIAFLVFVSIGYLQPNISILWLKVIVVYALLTAIKSIPLGIPAEVGLPDIAMTTLLILFGVPPDISAAATILTRLITVWLRFFIGFAAVQWLGVKFVRESGIF